MTKRLADGAASITTPRGQSGLERPRRYAVGAEITPGCGTSFRVWAPNKERIAVVLHGNDPGSATEIPLEAEGDGYFSITCPTALPGVLYGFRIDDGEKVYPDPAARLQPQGPEGLSQIVDSAEFTWTDGEWRGVGREGQVLYEMHFGTFTPEGTYDAAAEQLTELAKLGVTVIEVMPLADFAGKFGWGYDGTCLFAPTRLYGTPDDLRRFIDRAHAAGIGVILDVVYNHLGPGQTLVRFSDYYLSEKYDTDWGKALNFDGPESPHVREFFLANAAYWIDEFHFDGLRLDATQDIHDKSQEHILTAIVRRARAAAKDRAIYVVAENEPQHSHLVRTGEAGGSGIDALWNDDFHHSALVALCGRAEAYYTDYRGSPQEFISAAKYGYLYQGQWYRWQKKGRGRAGLDLPPSAFVNYIQNHDQVANSLRGARLHTLSSPARYRAMTALLLLMPGTPMLFQGQEFASSAPFLYFADHDPQQAAQVREGRLKFLAQFPSCSGKEAQAIVADPSARKTFERCKLDFSERESHRETYALHRDLLRLRSSDPAFSAPARGTMDGAVLGPETFALRFFGRAGDDRLLVVNLGIDTELSPAPEPLLASPCDRRWRLIWSSEEPCYGGSGTPPIEPEGNWIISGFSAIVMGAE